MLPDGNYTPEVDSEESAKPVIQPGLTYHLHHERIRGNIDGLDAVKQAAYLCLLTEHGSSPIFGSQYGLRKMDLISADQGLILGRLPRRIREALTRDDRITDVTDFTFSFPDKDSIVVDFRIHSIYGTVDGSHTVKVG